jgi:AcrR family transcriptional regulator
MTSPALRDERIEQIRRAAIEVFAAHGYQRSSMALIAQAVNMSRPALYQYFDDRKDVFRAAVGTLLEEATDAALEALAEAPDLRTALSGYLQRGIADGYERLSSLSHAQEILEAQHEFAADVAADETARMRDGLARAIERRADVAAQRRQAALDLLLLAPTGLKADRPDPDTYRRRLDGLADAVAAMLGT